MDSYRYQPTIVDNYTDANGVAHSTLNTRMTQQFKAAIESHVASLTMEIQTLKNHANWIEPRLNDYHKFMEWMQRVHPDVITAYTEATKVEKTLDNALEGGEMAYPQSEAAA